MIPVCPEILGGLPTPRVPAEKIDGKVKTEDGIDVTEKYIKGAEEAVHLAKLFGCKFAVMKERSPACGSGKVYDGSFSNILTDGYGVTAELFTKNGIKVFGESEIKLLLKELIGE